MVNIIPYIVLAQVGVLENPTSLYKFYADAQITFSSVVATSYGGNSNAQIDLLTIMGGSFEFNSYGEWTFTCDNLIQNMFLSDRNNVSEPISVVYDDFVSFTMSSFNYKETFRLESAYARLTQSSCQLTCIIDVVGERRFGETDVIRFGSSSRFQNIYTSDIFFCWPQNADYYGDPFVNAINSARSIVDSENNPMYNEGYQKGYDNGFYYGKSEGYQNGINKGYENGYLSGFNDGADLDSTAFTIFNGILSIGMLPINFFLAILNFEILGINIGGLVSALMTCGLVIYMIRMFMGGGS